MAGRGLAGTASSGGGHIMLELTPGMRPAGALVAWMPGGGGAVRVSPGRPGFAPRRAGSWPDLARLVISGEH